MKTSISRYSLHDLLKLKSYRHAVITTFAFSPRFFEDIALEKFRAFNENGNITVLIDAATLDSLISVGLSDSDGFPKRANLRYLLHPIATSGNFHPKIFLFATKDRGLLIIGSANLTREGLSSNAELISAFQFEHEKNEAALPLFQETFNYLCRLQTLNPSDTLESNLSAIRREATWLTAEIRDRPKNLPELLHNLDMPLWPQLCERVGRAQEVHVLSRYFDAGPQLLDSIVSDFAPRQIFIKTQNGITTLTKAWFEHPTVRERKSRIQICRYSDHDHAQPLHAKALAFITRRGTYLASGSANFTSAALRRTAVDGNAEILLLYGSGVTANYVTALFDPHHTAIELNDPRQLITAPAEQPEETLKDSATHDILVEATLENGTLVLRLRSAFTGTKAECVMQQTGERSVKVAVARSESNRLVAKLNETQTGYLRKLATIIHVHYKDANGVDHTTNDVLLTNLQEFATGRSLRQARQIAEARESPAKFISLLNELVKANDEERLKQFLTYCNIPLDFRVRFLPKIGIPRSATLAGEHQLRGMGRGNIRYFQSLHEAVLAFVERHRLRLDRHVERGTAQGIPNFAQILLTVVSLLVNQIEQLVAGLESNSVVHMAADEWHSIRAQLQNYYLALEDLLELTVRRYVVQLLEAYPSVKTKNRLSEYLGEIGEVWKRALDLRDRLNQLQREKLQIVVQGRMITGPGFFKTVLADQNWREFKYHVAKLQADLHQKLAA